MRSSSSGLTRRSLAAREQARASSPSRLSSTPPLSTCPTTQSSLRRSSSRRAAGTSEGTAATAEAGLQDVLADALRGHRGDRLAGGGVLGYQLFDLNVSERGGFRQFAGFGRDFILQAFGFGLGGVFFNSRFDESLLFFILNQIHIPG